MVKQTGKGKVVADFEIEGKAKKIGEPGCKHYVSGDEPMCNKPTPMRSVALIMNTARACCSVDCWGYEKSEPKRCVNCDLLKAGLDAMRGERDDALECVEGARYAISEESRLRCEAQERADENAGKVDNVLRNLRYAREIRQSQEECEAKLKLEIQGIMVDRDAHRERADKHCLEIEKLMALRSDKLADAEALGEAYFRGALRVFETSLPCHESTENSHAVYDAVKKIIEIIHDGT